MHVASAAEDFIAQAAGFAAAVQVWQVPTWVRPHIADAGAAGALDTAPPPTSGTCPGSLTMAGTISAPSGQVAAIARK